jgi:hypothetical protein
VRAAVLIYGKLERKKLGKQVGYQISLRRFEVDLMTQHGWVEWEAPSELTTDGLEQIAQHGYDKLHVVDCDDGRVSGAEAGVEEQISNGRWTDALATLEPILACKPQLTTKAFLAACRGKAFKKAYVYFKSVPATLAQICLKEGYDPRTNTMTATGQPP